MPSMRNSPKPKVARVRADELPRPARGKRAPVGPLEQRSVAPIRKRLTLPRTKPDPLKMDN